MPGRSILTMIRSSGSMRTRKRKPLLRIRSSRIKLVKKSAITSKMSKRNLIHRQNGRITKHIDRAVAITTLAPTNMSIIPMMLITITKWIMQAICVTSSRRWSRNNSFAKPNRP